MLKLLKRFYQFLWIYRGKFILFLLVLVVAGVIGNLGPYTYKLLIEALPSQNYRQILLPVLLYVGVRVISNWLSALSNFLGDRVLIPAARDARLTIFRHIQDLDFAFHVNKNTGSLISAFKRGDNAFFNLFNNIHHEIGEVAIGLTVLLFFFTGISPLITILTVAIFAGNILLGWQLIGINIAKRKLFNEVEDELSGIITDNLINYETVKFFAQEAKEERRLRRSFRDWTQRLWQYVNTFRLIDIVVGTVSNLGALLIFWLMIKRLITGQSSVGDFVLVTSFMTSFYYQFFRLLYHLRGIARDFTDIQSYFAILEEKILVRDPAKPVKLLNIQGEINFGQVSFAYPGFSKKVLKNINLLIKPGESVAFVGRSGVGKTTIVRLLLRFYDVAQGKIALDGVDIRRLAKRQLRSLIGIVPQEPILFNNTVEFNIGYGHQRATHHQIIKVAKMANLDNFIQSLPEQYQTQVGERGIKLSGGQKQRLAIARMLLTDPKVIIFDEATSNLDSESERLIQNALWKIARDRTLLIIAHRFATVRRVGKIVVMDRGRIVATGSHQQLIKNKQGIYQYLWRLQAHGPHVLR